MRLNYLTYVLALGQKGRKLFLSKIVCVLGRSFCFLFPVFVTLFFVIFFSLNISAQTLLINPGGDGGFEDGPTFSANGWSVVNDGINNWIIGTDAFFLGARGANISNNGNQNLYNPDANQTSHFFRDIAVPANETKIELSFYLKGKGEQGYDRLLVYYAPTSVTPVSGSPAQYTTDISGATLVYIQPKPFLNYTKQTILLPSSLAGTTFRLIFSWQNDNNTGENPPASIDNVSLVSSEAAQSYLTAGNYFFVVPTGVTSVDVQAWGGGGGGSDRDRNNGYGGGGGGGGGFAGGRLAVVPGGTVNVSVGAGGAGGNGNGEDGANGGNTVVSYGSISVTAGGGSGGTVEHRSAGIGGQGGTGSFSGAVQNFSSFTGGIGGAGDDDEGGAGGGGAGNTENGYNGESAAGDYSPPGGTGGSALGGKGGDGGNDTNGQSGLPFGGGGGASGDGNGVGANGADGAVFLLWSTCTVTAYTVFGGGEYCAVNGGVTVGLTNSESGVTYELYKNGLATGITKNSTGGALNFDPISAEGNYTVIGTDNGSGCSVQMNGSATIVDVSLAAPTINSIVQPTCLLGTGSVELGNLPTGNWELNQLPGENKILGSGTTTTITGLVPGSYSFEVTDLKSPGNGTGLAASYYNTNDLSGTPVLWQVDPKVDFNWGGGGPGSPVNNDNFSIRWRGKVVPFYSETYTFHTRSDDGVRLWVNGAQVVDFWTDHGAADRSGTIDLEMGTAYDIVLEYYERGGDAVIELGWESASQSREIIPQSQLYPEGSNVTFCSSLASADVVIDEQPLVPVAPTSVQVDRNNLCVDDGGNITLSVSGGSGTTVRWFNDACGGTEIGIGTTLTIPSPTVSTSYFARWENDCGNSACASVAVVINSLPIVTANATATQICPGESVVLTGGGAVDYSWDNNVNDGEEFVPAASATYTVTGADINGCTNTAQVTVDVFEDITFSESENETICLGDTATIGVNVFNDDKSILLDGATGGIAISDDDAINNTEHSVRSVALWFKANDVGSRQVLFEEGGGSNGFNIYIDGGNVISHGWVGSSWGAVSAAVNTDKWYHVAFVYNAAASDGEYFKFYLDGEYKGGSSAVAAADGMKKHGGNIFIGRTDKTSFVDGTTGNNSNHFNGYIDEFKLWNRSLSSEELGTEMYNVHEGTGGDSELIVYYNFNDDIATNVTDATGGNDASPVGGISYEKVSPFRPEIVWTPGNLSADTIKVSPSANTTYNFELTVPATGCTENGSIDVDVLTLTDPSVSAESATVCAGGDAIFIISGTAGDIISYDGDKSGNVIITSDDTAHVIVQGVVSAATINLTAVDNGICSKSLTGISATVTTGDTEDPVAGCRPTISVNVDANGEAAITPAMIDLGSTDNCGIDTMWVSPQVLSCDAEEGYSKEIVSADGYTVKVTISHFCVEPSTADDCPSGYNYNIGYDYDIEFSGTNIPANLYEFNVSFGCDSELTGLLSTTPGSGSGTTWDNLWRSQSDCATITIDDLNCSGVSVEIAGPGIPKQDVTLEEKGTVTLNVRDFEGNTNSCTSLVTLNDLTAPVPDIATLSDITADCEVTTLPVPTATDNCAGIINGTHNATLPITTPETTTVTWTYDDGNGNTSTQTQDVVVLYDPSSQAGVSITVAPSNTVCEGTEVTFSATPTNGGSNPLFQWQVDGVDVVGATGVSFETNTLTDGQQVRCVMTSNLPCVNNNPATSNIIALTVNPMPTIILVSNTSGACLGENSTTLEYSATTGTPNKYSLVFDAAAIAEGFFSVTNTNLAGGTINITVPVAASPAVYNAILTVVNDSNNCTSINYPVSIEVHALPNTGEITPD